MRPKVNSMKTLPSLQKILVIAGPTATGKTDLAVKLAAKFNGEIINADSRQVYRFMNIGTNKGKVSGWLFDIVKPDEEFNLSHYLEFANEIIKQIAAQGKLPILVGGTGLYIDAVIKQYQLSGNQPDWELRKQLAQLSVKELFTKLQSLNSDLALSLNDSDSKNPRRLIRLIEQAKQKNLKVNNSFPQYDYLLLYPKFSREQLYQKIDQRVEEMFAQGFIKETENLIKLGYKDCKPMQGMGYLEIQQYLQGKLPLEECKAKIKQAHRNYAARQITWFEGKGRGYNLQKFDFKKDYNLIINAVNNFL